MDDFLTTLKHERAFLETMWMDAHIGWDDKHLPKIMSAHMCRYTCLFMNVVLLQKYGQMSQIITGCPAEHQQATPNGMYGYQDAIGNWHDHSWLMWNNTIIDLTADQFGGQEITITPAGDTRYSPSPDQQVFEESFSKLKHRSDKWLKLYQQV